MKDDFPERLIKGRIVETIFQQMFLETGKYNVYPFGYEHTLPLLSQTYHDENVRNLIRDIRHLPDFVMTPKDKDGVYLVEVKYERIFDMNRVVKIAEKLHGHWTCPWIFVATQEKFYFDSCSDILNSKNMMRELDPEDWVDTEKQEYYLSLLRKFIQA